MTGCPPTHTLRLGVARANSLRLEEAVAAVTALQECGLIIQDGQSLLQALDLSGTVCLAILVRLCLRNAAILDLAVILVHSSQLRGSGVAIALVLRCGLAQSLGGLGLVLHITFLGRLGHLGRKITLHRLEDVDDAAASARRLAEVL